MHKKIKEGAFIHVTLGCILYNIFTIFFCKYCIYELSGCTFIYVRDRECRIQCLPLAALHFFLDNKEIALIINNEYPIKEKIEREKTVLISGLYKKGLFSSVMIVDYTIH